MASRLQVIELYHEHPDWSAKQIADALNCGTSYVRATGYRNNLTFGNGRAQRDYPSAEQRRRRHELGNIALKAGITPSQLRRFATFIATQPA